ncbi:hypothetical protein GCM10017667_60280 [Streptomyces filamentosus]|uniref:Uncharacterized protein n=1 Tax=Streptomyces filamentosus TaxID=67294 RepID=A0A919ES24_STRFL|nr:hypothetical protein GCM10017667_60280 [Streptomyces filamentosus]
MVAPSTAETTNHTASPAGRRSRHGRPRSTACTGPRHRPGSSPTSGSRTVSHSPTRAAVMSTSTVTSPAGECVTSPNSIAPGTTDAAK